MFWPYDSLGSFLWTWRQMCERLQHILVSYWYLCEENCNLFYKVWSLCALMFLFKWARSWENLFVPYGNDREADQSGHSCSLISVFAIHCLDRSHSMTKPTAWPVRPMKTQTSLGICPVWSESSLCTEWVAKDLMFFHANNKDTDQSGQMPRLIWVFTGRRDHFVGFVMLQFIVYLWWLVATSEIPRLLPACQFESFFSCPTSLKTGFLVT